MIQVTVGLYSDPFTDKHVDLNLLKQFSNDSTDTDLHFALVKNYAYNYIHLY